MIISTMNFSTVEFNTLIGHSFDKIIQISPMVQFSNDQFTFTQEPINHNCKIDRVSNNFKDMVQNNIILSVDERHDQNHHEYDIVTDKGTATICWIGSEISTLYMYPNIIHEFKHYT